MKKLIVLIGLFNVALQGKSQVYLDLGYRLSTENLELEGGDYFRGLDFYLSWCDCSNLTLGIQTREVFDGVSLDGSTYFPAIDFADYLFYENKLRGSVQKREVRIPLNYYRRFSLLKNFYAQANLGMFINLTYDKAQGDSRVYYNDENTQELNFSYLKNPNRSFILMDKLGVMAGLSLSYYVKPLGEFFIGINVQRNFKSFTDRYELHVTETTIDTDGNEIGKQTFTNQYSQKRTAPVIFLEIGFKTCGFNLSGNKKKKRSPSNGAWPF